jgi:hypothetical protein
MVVDRKRYTRIRRRRRIYEHALAALIMLECPSFRPMRAAKLPGFTQKRPSSNF